MKTCPSCGSELELIGDHGIVDWDDNWDAQAMKYRCVKGLHIVFLVDSRDIDEELTTPWVKARDAIHHTVKAALWETPFRFANLEDFRNELSNVAMKAFENYKNSTQAYDYIEALKDVDDALTNYDNELRKLGLKKVHDPIGGGGGSGRSDFPAGSRGGED